MGVELFFIILKELCRRLKEFIRKCLGEVRRESKNIFKGSRTTGLPLFKIKKEKIKCLRQEIATIKNNRNTIGSAI